MLKQKPLAIAHGRRSDVLDEVVGAMTMCKSDDLFINFLVKNRKYVAAKLSRVCNLLVTETVFARVRLDGERTQELALRRNSCQ